MNAPSPAYGQLKDLIQTGKAKVGIVGLGYVGLPLADALVEGGLRVLGFDVDEDKVDMLLKGECYLQHFGESRTLALSESEKFEATAEFGRLAEPDVIVVCVPTPIGQHQEPDLSFVTDSAARIGKTLRAGQLVILESTTYPGTTRGPFLEAMSEASTTDLSCGEDFFVAYSPEREDPGRSSHSTKTIPKLVGGLDAQSTELATMVYGFGVEAPTSVKSAEVAEAAKLLENIFRSVNIALVNELKMILHPMGIDVWDVVDAASTKPFGFMPFYPGPGLGGHCIPIDPFYLAWKAKEVGHTTRFVELAGSINTGMPDWVVSQVQHALNEEAKPVNGSRILVLGLAYKPDVDDTRESPSFEIIDRLRALGAEVAYSDPHVPHSRPVRRHDLGMTSQELSPSGIQSYDAIVIATDHRAFDWSLVAENARLIVDTRNAIPRSGQTPRGRYVKA